MATPPSTDPTHTLPRRKRNHELTKPSSQANDSRTKVKGSRSVLMPPVAAASYQSPRRSHISEKRPRPDWPSTSDVVCHATMTYPTARPAKNRTGPAALDFAKSRPVTTERSTISNSPGVSTHPASRTVKATTPMATASSAKESHPSRGVNLSAACSKGCLSSGRRLAPRPVLETATWPTPMLLHQLAPSRHRVQHRHPRTCGSARKQDHRPV